MWQADGVRLSSRFGTLSEMKVELARGVPGMPHQPQLEVRRLLRLVPLSQPTTLMMSNGSLPGDCVQYSGASEEQDCHTGECHQMKMLMEDEATRPMRVLKSKRRLLHFLVRRPLHQSLSRNRALQVLGRLGNVI